jgi:pheromone a factor receptor
MAPTNLAYQVIAPISMLLILLPLPWHWSARNVGTLLYIAWSFTGSLVFFVNSIVWNGNLSNPTPVWCDISTKFMVGLGVAVPAVSLCINRRLYKIATMKKIALNPSDVRLGSALICYAQIYQLRRNGTQPSSICALGSVSPSS